MLKGTFSLQDRGPMMADLIDRLTDLSWSACYNKQRLLLIFLIKHMQHLCRSILEYDRIKCLVKTK